MTSPRTLFIAVFLLASCSSPTPFAVDPANRLAQLVAARLDWMDEVAAIKRERGQPIVDARREAALLDAMAAKGRAAGLPAKAVRGFFTGQMEAAKECQRRYLAEFRAEKRHLPDLDSEIRPALDRIGGRMIQVLAQARAANVKVEAAQKEVRRELLKHRYPESVIRPALQGLAAGLE